MSIGNIPDIDVQTAQANAAANQNGAAGVANAGAGNRGVAGTGTPGSTPVSYLPLLTQRKPTLI